MTPQAHALSVPVRANAVDSPILSYGDGPIRIEFMLDDDESWGRITFEKLDAIRVSRGEYSPFVHRRGEPWSWVSTVSNSPWLKERYLYEERHYRQSYEFNGDVDEMLRDYQHYLFTFHDEFVEAISAGIWIESATGRIGNTEFSEGHPLSDLPELPVAGTVSAHNLICEVRQNQVAVDRLLQQATLCSQKLLQFRLSLDGSTAVHWTLRLRTRAGQPVSQLCGYFGNVVQEFPRIATLDDVRPQVEKWLGEVAERRTSRR